MLLKVIQIQLMSLVNNNEKFINFYVGTYKNIDMSPKISDIKHISQIFTGITRIRFFAINALT